MIVLKVMVEAQLFGGDVAQVVVQIGRELLAALVDEKGGKPRL
jgi:hypothetical protein